MDMTAIRILRRCPMPTGELLLAGERAIVQAPVAISLCAGVEPFAELDRTPLVKAPISSPPKDQTHGGGK